MKDGTTRFSSEVDFEGDAFNRSHESDEGWYVWFGMWKGPFESEARAKDACAEWLWEAKNS